MKYLLASLILLSVSCSKTNYQQTKILVTVQEGSDNMLFGSALFCYKQDWGRIHDTILYSNAGLQFDTTYIRTSSTIFWKRGIPTGKVDSSFVFAGVQVDLIGPIVHREYATILSINQIIYGN